MYQNPRWPPIGMCETIVANVFLHKPATDLNNISFNMFSDIRKPMRPLFH